ncbi:MAG: enolase C-terminal domain-like protein, partial [Caulobacterales bacterium]
MRLAIESWAQTFRLAEPFVISSGAQTDQPTFQVRLTDESGRVGRGEACGASDDETPGSMIAAIESVRARLAQPIDREALLDVLPPGGARFAVDSALWDLEAKQGLGDPFTRSGLKPGPVTSDQTIGIRSLDEYAAAARALADYRDIKVKVGADDPIAALAAVRREAPRSRLIVDPNQAWSVDQLQRLVPELLALDVALIEQPIPVGAERELDGFRAPIPLCADELIHDVRDLDRAQGRFQVINIKLDKAGGLTNALKLADEAEARGFQLMVGCMNG